jgi:transcriptional regulator with XRE-family HTH domain
MTPDSQSVEAIGARLKELREASGLSQAAWCRSVGITTTAWNRYEHATLRIGIDQAFKVVLKTGVSLDWIYRGQGSPPPRR